MKDTVCFIGCSNVSGTGVPEHLNTPSVYSRITGKSVENLGVPGSGLDAHILTLLDRLESGSVPSMIVYGHTVPTRRLDYTDAGEAWTYRPNENASATVSRREYGRLVAWATRSSNSTRCWYAHLWRIFVACTGDIPLMHYHTRHPHDRHGVVVSGAIDYPGDIDRGSDGIHPGPQWHETVARRLNHEHEISSG